ncbi:hypothetical protein MRX96_020118 [Rhipicephalus microplus]
MKGLVKEIENVFRVMMFQFFESPEKVRRALWKRGSFSRLSKCGAQLRLEGVEKPIVFPHGILMVRLQGSQLASTQRDQRCHVEHAFRIDCVVGSPDKGWDAVLTSRKETACGDQYIAVARPHIVDE